MKPPFDVVIAGAGVAALATARYLRRAAPTARIGMVTPHAPMSLTSSLSSECFRDHWPSEVMRAFMARSISLLEGFSSDTGGAFGMQKAGYLYTSVGGAAAAVLLAEARACHGESGVRLWGRSHPPPPPRSEYATAAAAAALAGADVFCDNAVLTATFPFLASTATAGMHVRNAGWCSAQTMGMVMLDELQAAAERGDGTPPSFELLRGRIVGATLRPSSAGDRIDAVEMESLDGSTRQTLTCGAFVNATGPALGATHAALFGDPAARPPSSAAHSFLGVRGPGATHGLPVYSEVHAKVVFRDTLGVIPRDAPMTISSDQQTLDWSDDERGFLSEAYGEDTMARLSSPMPAGCHFRPYGGPGSNAVLMLWEAWHHGLRPSEPPPESLSHLLDHELYPEVVLRGLAQVVPDLAAYFNDDVRESVLARRAAGNQQQQQGQGDAAESSRKPFVDGGCYTKVEENTPLIGPAPGRWGQGRLSNGFVCGALSGYGIMASHAAGELAAAHVLSGHSALLEAIDALCAYGAAAGGPPIARAFSPLRYQDEEYMRPGGGRDALLSAGGGQL